MSYEAYLRTTDDRYLDSLQLRDKKEMEIQQEIKNRTGMSDKERDAVWDRFISNLIDQYNNRRIAMFDDIKRKNEIAKVLYWAGGVIPLAPFNDIISEILSQEKLMIEQAKKEAVKEFAEKILKEATPWENQDKENINKILKQYGVKI